MAENPTACKAKSYFETGLDVGLAFREAEKHGKYNAALSKFEAVRAELSKDEGAGALAAGTWMSLEAYQATGNKDYVGLAKKYGNALIDEPVQRAEDKLLAASALMQLYEFSRNENYKEKAEALLKSFESNCKFYATDKKQKDAINKLAAVTYLGAHRLAKGHIGQAKRFLDASGKSLILYSEANQTFNSRKYRQKYDELLKEELKAPCHSLENLAGVSGEPLFRVKRYDPDLGVLERAHLHMDKALLSAGKKVAYHALPLASKAVYGMGSFADWFGGGLEKEGDALAGAGWGRAGRAAGKLGRGVKFFFGTETLKRTSIVVGGSGVLSIPGLDYVGNISLGGAFWPGDINYFEQNEGVPYDYHRYVYLAVNTPVASAGNSTYGFGSGINAIPYFRFYANPRMESATIGLPGYAAFWFGKVGTDKPGQYARGPYVGVNIGFGLAAFSASVYYPPLGPMVDYLLDKPAGWLRSKNDALLNGLKKLF